MSAALSAGESAAAGPAARHDREGRAAERRPRLGIFSPSRSASGPGRHVETLLAGLDRSEFDVTLFCCSYGGYRNVDGVQIAYVDEAAAEGPPAAAPIAIGGAAGRGGAGAARRRGAARVARAVQRGVGRTMPEWLRYAVYFCREARRLRGRMRAHGVDLLHTQYSGCINPCGPAARLAGIPRVLGTFHVDSTYDLQRKQSSLPYRVLEYAGNHSLHRAIAVSETTKQDWMRRTRMPASRIVTIHNGVDPDHFRRRTDRAGARRQLGLPEEGRTILGGVGRLDAVKGFEYLLEGVALLAGEHPELMVALAGSGPEREALEARAERLGIADRVRFLGFRSDMTLVYDALDAFVLPSLCEALPYVLLEAMAHELPVVGTAVAGVPEVIVENETGFVVPARDAARLAAAMRRLLRSAELRTQLGKNGRERVVRRFHVRDSVRKTIDVYREMLGGCGGAG